MDRWFDLAELLNDLRVIPRLLIGTYTYVWYDTIQWYQMLPDPTGAQSTLVSVVTGAGAAWFGLYVQTGGKK